MDVIQIKVTLLPAKTALEFGSEVWVLKKREERLLTFWTRNYFFSFSTPCVYNTNNTGTKYDRIMKQIAF